MEPKILDILVGQDVERHHDEQHLAEGELAGSPVLGMGGDQVVRLPRLKQRGQVMETTDQGNGGVGREGALRFFWGGAIMTFSHMNLVQEDT